MRSASAMSSRSGRATSRARIAVPGGSRERPAPTRARRPGSPMSRRRPDRSVGSLSEPAGLGGVGPSSPGLVAVAGPSVIDHSCSVRRPPGADILGIQNAPVRGAWAGWARIARTQDSQPVLRHNALTRTGEIRRELAAGLRTLRVRFRSFVRLRLVSASVFRRQYHRWVNKRGADLFRLSFVRTLSEGALVGTTGAIRVGSAWGQGA